MPFFAPMPWEAEQLLRAAGHGGEELHARLVAGRHRRLHALRERSRTRAWCSTRNPNFRGEPYPPEGEPGDRERGLLADAGKTVPFIDRVVYHAREGRHSATGTSSCRATTTPPASAPTTSTRRCASRIEGEPALTPEMEAQRHPARHLGRADDRSTSASTGSTRWSAATRERARASCARRSSIAVDWEEYHLDLRQRPRRAPRRARSRRASSATARAGTASTRWSTNGRTASRSAGRSRRRRSCSPRPAIPTGATRRPASRWCSTSTPWQRGPGDKRGVRLVPQAVRQALDPARDPRPPTGTASRRSCARAARSCSSSAGTPTIPDPGELPVPAARPAEPREEPGRERRQLRRTRSTTRLFEQMKNMPNSPERQQHHRPHGRHRPRATRPGSGGYPPEELQPAPLLAAQRQAERTWRATSSSTCSVDPAKRARLRAPSGTGPVLWPLVGAVRCCCVAAVVPAIRGYRRRERMAAQAGGLDARLHRPPGAVRDPDPDRGEPASPSRCSSSSTRPTTWRACSSARSA